VTGADAGESEAGVHRLSAGLLRSRWDDERELTDAIHATVVGSAVTVAASRAARDVGAGC
jgi:hypothetical protein